MRARFLPLPAWGRTTRRIAALAIGVVLFTTGLLVKPAPAISRPGHVALAVGPHDVLVDQPVTIRVSGVRPRSLVTIRATTESVPGKRWLSTGVFRADATGVVVVASSASLGGTYRGRHGMGLFWSMRLVGSHLPLEFQGMFPAGLASVTTVRFSASQSGRTLARATLIRRTAAPGVVERKTTLARDGFVGCFYSRPNATATPSPAILVLGGSEGGLPCDFTSSLLASHGVQVLALAYFGVPGLPPNLRMIPLEYFRRALEWLRRQPGVDRDKLVVLGGSRGGEAALLLGSVYPTLVHGVAEYVGSATILGSPGEHATSAWKLRGKPVEIGTTIPVERINGPVFLVGALEDMLGNSVGSVDTVVARLQANHRSDYTALIYRSGHSVVTAIPNIPTATVFHTRYGGLDLGGLPLDASLARADSWPKLVAFLKHLD